MYDVGSIYKTDGQDRWRCTSLWRRKVGHKPPNLAIRGPIHYKFRNVLTREVLSGTEEDLPEFREVERVEAA